MAARVLHLRRHQISADFKRYDYVNPDAPKGGVARLFELGTYDSFNMVVAGLKGSIASGVGQIYDSLMDGSLDEPDTYYGTLAEGVAYPEDFSYAIFRLRAAARWHDGKPVTPDDVVFSFDVFKTHSPRYSTYYRHITKAEKIGERDIKFTFDGPGNRELPLITGQLNVLPKHWWEVLMRRTQARRDGDHIGAAARLGSLPDQGVRGRTIGGARARQGLLGQGLAQHGRRTILMSFATSSSATTPLGARR